jgi:hypothetical protein
LLAVLAVVNVVQFPLIDKPMPPYASAIHAYPHPDVVEIGIGEDPNARSRYTAYVALAQIAPGSTVLLPTQGAGDSYRTQARFLGLGEAANVAYVDLDATDLWEDALEVGTVAAVGSGGFRGAPWQIIVDEREAPFDAGTSPETYLKESLDEDTWTAPPGPPRTWLWIYMPVERKGSDYSFQNVLVEISLLNLEVAPESAP